MASILASAKINLALHVTGIREDGYHTLSSLVAFADFGDRLEVAPADTLSLTLKGVFAAPLEPEKAQNLVVRAARRLQQHLNTRQGAAITLHKQLPVASGIGGGSADAAAACRLLCGLWGYPLTPEALAVLLLPLGADIPVCLHQKTALISGIGEIISPLPALPAFGLVLVNPLVAVSTADMFRAFDRTGRCDAPVQIPQPLPTSQDAWLEVLHESGNSLQAHAIAQVSVIAEVLAALQQAPECRVARMSGSGATCFALCDTVALAETLALRLQQHHPNWWIKSGGFLQ